IRNAVPDDGIVVSGMTQVGYYSRPYYPVYQPGTFLTSSYFGNLGYAYPTALGAKVARPEAALVAISGEGGFLFNSQELATALASHAVSVLTRWNVNNIAQASFLCLTRPPGNDRACSILPHGYQRGTDGMVGLPSG